MTDSIQDDGSTVHQAFEDARREFGVRPFLHIPRHSSSEPVDLTYRQAGLLIADLSRVYARAGYRKGHHIALLADSGASFFLHFLALNGLGATIIPIGVELSADEAADLLARGDADLFVTITRRREHADRTGGLAKSVPVATFAAIEAGQAPKARTPRGGLGMPDVAAIVFTSGSTGKPKGCLLSNLYFSTFGRWYRDLGGRCSLRPGVERLITPLPLNHVNALVNSSMGMIMTGGCIVQLDRFHSGSWWEQVRASGATLMHYLGVMPAMLLQLPPSEADRRHQLRFGFGGGVSAAHHLPFEERFSFPLVEAWAMTETGGAGAISSHIGPRHIGRHCIGRPSPQYTKAAIIDDDGGEVPDGEIGELRVRAAGTDPRRGFFSGYYKDPAATEKVWEGGWLHTGDIARRGPDGSFFFVGRSKQIIRRSGENISAREVEEVLRQDERIEEIAVVPVPDDIRQEEVFACVVMRRDVPTTAGTAQSILDRATARLAYYKLPGYIAFLDTLPVTATQKLRYGAIGELVAKLLAAEGTVGVHDLREAKRRHRKR
jgi:acyl-CoA synthetase (AMP-forming)/AMP-acid ligase II